MLSKRYCINVLKKLVTLAGLFIAALITFVHAKEVMQGQWKSLQMVVFYGFVIIFVLLRKEDKAQSLSPVHWLIAVGGTAAIFFYQSAPAPVHWLAMLAIPIQIISIICVTISLFFLGKGFGIIAALREVKTQGPYQLVRHPLYASEILLMLPIIMQNQSWANVGLFCLIVACQIARIHEEEAVLSLDDSYCTYKHNVHYRLIPGVY